MRILLNAVFATFQLANLENLLSIISIKQIDLMSQYLDQVAALARPLLNGSIPLDRTIQQITETMPLALKYNSFYTLMTNRVASLRELLFQAC